jgi:hypothetical protein
MQPFAHARSNPPWKLLMLMTKSSRSTCARFSKCCVIRTTLLPSRLSNSFWGITPYACVADNCSSAGCAFSFRGVKSLLLRASFQCAGMEVSHGILTSLVRDVCFIASLPIYGLSNSIISRPPGGLRRAGPRLPSPRRGCRRGLRRACEGAGAGRSGG